MLLGKVAAVASPVVLAVGAVAMGSGLTASTPEAPAVERLVVSAAAATPDDDLPRRSALGVPLLAPQEVTTLAQTDAVVLDVGPDDVPVRVLAAYRAASDRLASELPGCGLRWELVAAIGRIESNHGRYGGARVLESGRVEPAILGPRLDGVGPVAEILDTDGGRHDGDVELDRAVGPMQFIPGTWARWGADGDGDGAADPHDIDDAALSAGRYLCASGARLDTADGMVAAVYSYNHSYDYVRAVLSVAAAYAGVAPEAFGTGSLPSPTRSPAGEAVLASPVAVAEAAPGPIGPAARTTGPAASVPEPASSGSEAPTAPPDTPSTATTTAPSTAPPSPTPTACSPSPTPESSATTTPDVGAAPDATGSPTDTTTPTPSPAPTATPAPGDCTPP